MKSKAARKREALVPSRRQVIRGGMAVAGMAVANPILSACRRGGKPSPAGTTLKIGFVSPRTGATAAFGEPDGYVLELARKALAAGLVIDGKPYQVELIDKDSQSNPQRSAQVANELITGDGVDLMMKT